VDDASHRREGSHGAQTVKYLVTFIALGLITFLVVVGALRDDINYSAVAMALSAIVGGIWGTEAVTKRRNGSG
jgi:hypothetical protein